MRPWGWLLAALIGLLVLIHASPAAAHGRNTSYSRWTLGADEVEVSVRIAARELDSLGGLEALPDHFELADCERSRDSLEQRRALAGEAIVSWRYTCRGRTSEASVGLFAALGPAHLHIARTRGPSGEWGPKQILTASDPSITLDAELDEASRTWPRFVGLGFAHILEGWDHLAFVLALLLGAASLARVASLVTGFTLGHSLTLGLAALGIARPEPVLVELLIAASIVIVAARTVQGDRDGWEAEQVGAALGLVALAAALGGRVGALATAGAALFAWAYLRSPDPAPESRERGWAPVLLVAGFGLIHGAGFAGVLQEVGLPEGARVSSLLAFNLGVELGQLCFVALMWPLLSVARKRWPSLAHWGALALACLGMAAVSARAMA